MAALGHGSKLRAKMFPVNPPATTTVIAKLLDPRFLIEIKGMAVLDRT